MRFLPTSDSVTLDTRVTDDTLPDMAACNIRNIDASLLREMKIKAVSEGMTLRDWVIRALTVAVGWENGPSEIRHRTAQDAEGAVEGELGALPKKRRSKAAVSDGPPDCPRCGKKLREWGPGWNCEDCRTNYPKA